MCRLQIRAARGADAIYITDLQGVIVYVNPAFEILTGYSKDEAVGGTPALFNTDVDFGSFRARLWTAMREGRDFHFLRINRKRNGDQYCEETRSRPFVDMRGAVTHCVFSGRDVSDRVNAMKLLERMATHDVLTDLPNRALFQDRLGKEYALAKRNGGGFALCILDVDKLKPINDIHGHSAGDLLLQTLAGLLKFGVRDIDTVARLGGDEFGMILSGISRREDARQVVAKILDSLRNGAARGDCLLPLTASIGISLYPDDGADEHMLLRRADQAMYRAKGGGGYCFFDARLDGSSVSMPDFSPRVNGERTRAASIISIPFYSSIQLTDGAIYMDAGI
jgi:diguanylate cyclase (GGDEF)-like protein/PAS domain S-box-containing protein